MVVIHSNSDSSGEIWEIARLLLAAASVTHLVKFINKPISPQPGRVCNGDAAPVGRGESWSTLGLF